ncbi:MAG: hypothetical protein KJ970_18335 [Candidatus Eisenbacteria bacterium]|uniref:Uncharacterized protein n=1 Tax=Eiseniibacteriota bacterium TaxID=2212470 RepID=A0A948S090_UNCEI|nr:hypothetical protein [Candidatus Eisenbacteria bacterium]
MSTPGGDEGASPSLSDAADDAASDAADETLIRSPVWAQELQGLWTDLDDLVQHWVLRQGPHGRFLPSALDRSDSTSTTAESLAVEVSPEDWESAFEVVETWPCYLSITGDQPAFAALMALCFAFADDVLGLAPEDSAEAAPPQVMIPAAYRGATATLISYSYALVPHSPAETWLRAIEDRWSFPRHDPLQVRLELALLRLTRDSGRADRIRAAAADYLSRPISDRLDENLEAADLMIDLASILPSQGMPGHGPGKTELLEKVAERLTKAIDAIQEMGKEEAASRSGLLTEIALRYRALSQDQRIDTLLIDWIYSGEQGLHLSHEPLPAGFIWKVEGGDDALATALKTARIELDRHRQRLRGEASGLWDGERIKCRDAAALLALLTQAGLSTRNGRVPDILVRYRDAHGVLGLRHPVSAFCETNSRNEVVVSFWHDYIDPVTVWVEPALEGARLGRSWWEINKKNEDGEGEKRWSPLPYLKIGRVGPLVLGRKKSLHLRMEWLPGESLIGQWCEPAKKPMVLGPGGPALR